MTKFRIQLEGMKGMMLGKKMVLLIVLALALVMAACATPTPTPAAEPLPVNDTGNDPLLTAGDGGQSSGMMIVGYELMGDWNLVSLNGHDLVEGSSVTIGFDGLQITGMACNSYFGGYEVDANSISFGNIGSTEMYCMDTSDQEVEYFDALARVNAWSVQGATLELSGDGVSLVYAKAVAPSDISLEGTTWMLESFVDGGDAVSSLIAGTSISATIVDGQITGNATCNSYSAGVTVDGAGITVGEVMSTEMACETGMDQEQRYLQMLGEVSTWQIDGDMLTLSADNANSLIFRAQ